MCACRVHVRVHVRVRVRVHVRMRCCVHASSAVVKPLWVMKRASYALRSPGEM